MSNVNELRKSSAFCEDGMKPKIKLAHSWGDCGHHYQWWTCSMGVLPVGFGASPKAAYRDWLAKGEKV